MLATVALSGLAMACELTVSVFNLPSIMLRCRNVTAGGPDRRPLPYTTTSGDRIGILSQSPGQDASGLRRYENGDRNVM